MAARGGPAVQVRTAVDYLFLTGSLCLVPVYLQQSASLRSIAVAPLLG